MRRLRDWPYLAIAAAAAVLLVVLALVVALQSRRGGEGGPALLVEGVPGGVRLLCGGNRCAALAHNITADTQPGSHKLCV